MTSHRGGPPCGHISSETALSTAIGPSLVDSDDELFASRLPDLSKHLSKPREVLFFGNML